MTAVLWYFKYRTGPWRHHVIYNGLTIINCSSQKRSWFQWNTLRWSICVMGTSCWGSNIWDQIETMGMLASKKNVKMEALLLCLSESKKLQERKQIQKLTVHFFSQLITSSPFLQVHSKCLTVFVLAMLIVIGAVTKSSDTCGAIGTAFLSFAAN